MKKSILTTAVAMIALGAIISQNTTSKSEQPSDVDLATLEAIAACEVSSDPAKNTGYCVPLHNNPAVDVCVSELSHDAVRCCGTIL